jgi:hypothetical protein
VASSAAPATSAESGQVPKPAENRGILLEKLGPILAAHYRGLGQMEQYRYNDAVDAFRPTLPMPLAQMSGMLTRYGSVTELLTKDDDHLCLVGPGDDVRIEIDAAGVPPLAAGWIRSYVLRAVGYCKDADLFTAAGDTVGPLPWRGMTAYPFGPATERPRDPESEAYLREYQIRSAGTGASGRANP